MAVVQVNVSWALIVRVKLCDLVRAGVELSVTVAATLKVPLAVGVPVIAPLLLIDSPAGRPVAVKVRGAVPPLARTVELYGTCRVPAGSVVVVIVTPATTVIVAVPLAIPARLEVAVIFAAPTAAACTGTVTDVWLC